MKKVCTLLIMVCVLLAGCQSKDSRGSKPELAVSEDENQEEQQSANSIQEITKSEDEGTLKEALVDQVAPQEEDYDIIDEDGETLEERFLPPAGYKRVEVSEGSFGKYLRSLPLKEHGTKVRYHDGRTKNRTHVYLGVVDLDIGKRNLHQCADAVMLLRGEYLFHKGEYDAIHFNFTNGFRVDYSKWMEGYRVKIQGNDTSFVKSSEPSNTYRSFRKYMDLIFAYAGTLSLAKELEAVDYMDMAVGDVFIQGGSPGHAVIVVDMAVCDETDEKLYMLAQSYMPAQETQILCNPSDTDSPWYRLEECSQIHTPEWTFYPNDLKRFSE